MSNYRTTHVVFVMLAIGVRLFACEESKEQFTYSTSTLAPNITLCSDRGFNTTKSCILNTAGVTPNSLMQRISVKSPYLVQSKQGEEKSSNTHVLENDDENFRKVKEPRNAKAISLDDVETTVNKLPIAFEKFTETSVGKKPPESLYHETVLDKRASNLGKQEEIIPSAETTSANNAKFEKTNEVIPDSIAEETEGVTQGAATDQSTVTANVNTGNSETESPGLTTVGVTDADSSVVEKSDGKFVVPTLIVREDEDNRLTHKVTSIPRNTITRVAVQDCPCDVIKNVCDINCCCDNDCTVYDRLVFSQCLPLPSVSSSQYCFSKQLIYIKNSPFYITKHPDNSLLCIETENLKAKTNFTQLKPITNLKNFAKVFERKKHNEWSKAVLRTPIPYTLNRLPHNQSYKVGQPIWLMNSTSVKLFELPTHSILSDECSSRRPIFYLEDSSSDCLVHITECSPNTLLRSELYYKNFLLLASTSFENLTSINNCTKQSCLQVEPFFCLNDHCSQIQDDIHPVWDPDRQMCSNVTQSLHYVLKHNGTRGLTRVILYVRMANVTLGQSVRLKTKASFEWHNSVERVFRRSGNPGYRTRAPIISGTRVSFNLSQEDQTIPSIHLSHSPQDWVTMLAYTAKGECDENQRRNLLFGINEQVMCKFVFSQKRFTDCDSIQRHIYKLLLGNLRYFDSDTYIASNGDPSIYTIEDWIPILWSKSSQHYDPSSLPCGNLATGIHIKILHAYSGAFDNPDSKIIGALIETYKHSALTCLELSCQIDLSWSVSFVHSANTRFTKFPEPPVYEIKLPSNFFYPFLSSAESVCFGGCRLHVLVLCCVCTLVRWISTV